MSGTIDEITVNYEQDGELVVKELDKQVLTRGAWTTILFKYQELDRKTGDFGPVRFGIRRYQKSNDVYRQKSKFNISNAQQAKQIIETLSAWVAELEAEE